MANAGPLNVGLSSDGPLTGSKRKSADMQDGTEVDTPRSMKIARKESQEKGLTWIRRVHMPGFLPKRLFKNLLRKDLLRFLSPK